MYQREKFMLNARITQGLSFKQAQITPHIPNFSNGTLGLPKSYLGEEVEDPKVQKFGDENWGALTKQVSSLNTQLNPTRPGKVKVTLEPRDDEHCRFAIQSQPVRALPRRGQPVPAINVERLIPTSNISLGMARTSQDFLGKVRKADIIKATNVKSIPLDLSGL